MKKKFKELSPRKLGIISKIVMPLGIILLALSIWGFVKSGHTSMSGKNGSSATLVIVSLRWVLMLLGVCSLFGGFWLLKKSETADETASKNDESKEEDDPLDFLK